MRSSKTRLLALFILSLMFCPATLKSSDKADLLTEADLLLQIEDRSDGPALQSGSHERVKWKSYNQWLCFDTSDVIVTNVSILYGNRFKKIPQIKAKALAHTFEISLSVDRQDNEGDIFNKWKELLLNSKQVCAYAAHLPKVDPAEEWKSSIWIIQSLKTYNGYWNDIDIAESE